MNTLLLMKNYNRACEFVGCRGGVDVSLRPDAILSLQRTLTQITHKINHALGKCSLRLTHSCTLYERKGACDGLATASTDLQRSEYDAV
jgi:hypothetical protein